MVPNERTERNTSGIVKRQRRGSGDQKTKESEILESSDAPQQLGSNADTKGADGPHGGNAACGPATQRS